MAPPTVLLVLLLAGVPAAGCSGDDNAPQGDLHCSQLSLPGLGSNASFDAAGIFTDSPMALDAISFIIPLGNLNPPGHTYPSDHIYFALIDASADSTSISAAASATVLDIYNPGDGPDTKIILGIDKSFIYYYDHMHVDPAIRVGDTITAGQAIGATSGNAAAFDFGVFNFNHTVEGLVDPCLQQLERGVDAPLAYYTGALQASLYGKVMRNGSDKDGRIGYDIAGTLAGDWSQQGAPFAGLSNVAQELSFVYDTATPTAMRVSVGGTVAPAGVYAVGTSDIDFGSVSTASGLTTYSLYAIVGGAPPSTTPSGALLVQLTSDTELQIEYFAGAAMTGAAFDGSALQYKR